MATPSPSAAAARLAESLAAPPPGLAQALAQGICRGAKNGIASTNGKDALLQGGLLQPLSASAAHLGVGKVGNNGSSLQPHLAAPTSVEAALAQLDLEVRTLRGGAFDHMRSNDILATKVDQLERQLRQLALEVHAYSEGLDHAKSGAVTRRELTEVSDALHAAVRESRQHLEEARVELQDELSLLVLRLSGTSARGASPEWATREDVAEVVGNLASRVAQLAEALPEGRALGSQDLEAFELRLRQELEASGGTTRQELQEAMALLSQVKDAGSFLKEELTLAVGLGEGEDAMITRRELSDVQALLREEMQELGKAVAEMREELAEAKVEPVVARLFDGLWQERIVDLQVESVAANLFDRLWRERAGEMQAGPVAGVQELTGLTDSFWQECSGALKADLATSLKQDLTAFLKEDLHQTLSARDVEPIAARVFEALWQERSGGLKAELGSSVPQDAAVVQELSQQVGSQFTQKLVAVYQVVEAVERESADASKECRLMATRLRELEDQVRSMPLDKLQELLQTGRESRAGDMEEVVRRIEAEVATLGRRLEQDAQRASESVEALERRVQQLAEGGVVAQAPGSTEAVEALARRLDRCQVEATLEALTKRLDKMSDSLKDIRTAARAPSIEGMGLLMDKFRKQDPIIEAVMQRVSGLCDRIGKVEISLDSAVQRAADSIVEKALERRSAPARVGSRLRFRPSLTDSDSLLQTQTVRELLGEDFQY